MDWATRHCGVENRPGRQLANAQGEFRDKSLLSNRDALPDWLRADMRPIDIDRVRVLYRNSRNMLIRDELANEGSIDQSAIYVRELIKRAL